MKRCAIVGLGMITGPQPGKTGRMLDAEVARLAIEDAGLERSQVNGAIHLRSTGGPSEPPPTADAFPRLLGLPVNFYNHVGGRGGSSATLGIATAMGFLDMGLADYIVLAKGGVGYSQSRAMKEQGYIGSSSHTVEKEGYWGRPFGELRAVSFHSFIAARHMHEYGTTSRQLGMIAVQTRQWAQMNPRAKFYGRPISIEDHQNSPYVVYPYHLLDICVQNDGGVAFVITTEDRARDLRQPPVWVYGVGVGESMGELWWEKQNYTQLPVKTAKEQAFRQAGITLTDIDCAQLYDCFTAEVLFQLEDYGWCNKGEGGPFVEEGHIGPEGDIPVNTSGGLLSAYHFGDCTGLSEAVLQLRGQAGERQVPDCEFAMFTGHGGEALSPMCPIHGCVILGRS